ncbi:LuxR family DNA-binding response regulator [Pseudomonas cannabina pv. alisalensis]|uniref:LuxR family DNA-binding response regulator n=2 Tax=Pseudomonas cannabina TaxID=86840 RepID=A0A3M3RNU4_PSECA|nr:response regulator transcription factor [Pseudomonas cannabina]KPW20099.1 LuxR family DNA-binding response regulator [Pseudomonas cannabina pv. alisalensis]MBM0137382.1 response regulator transcription factor [Pseudomonas cannabina pv. alisalensis]RMN82447.1 LuxR family DNA-binding response regulator [Pseudomonas cannabina]RMN84503.1 LuxR family DNA-binding response regulator [Pseudomonas cannabina pv. alisalensis]RMN98076.1 LuxR family DNA-binding response regulator [Pseudomonas cannabina]
MTCNLMLIDDHALIRAGVRALVANIPGYAIIGETADGAQLASLAQRLQPHIILLDICMKYVDGLGVLRELRRTQPHCKVLILSMLSDPEMILRALEAGAHGYLLKDATATELERALDALRNDERYLSPAIAHVVIERSNDATPHDGRLESKERYNLTARQLEILRLIVRGKSTREIAAGLGLSIKTVETHRSQIMKRLQIYDVAGLVMFCVRERIISLDD